MTVFTLLEIISALSFIAMTAYLTGRSRFIMRCARYPFSWVSQFPLVVLFAFLAITGNYNTLPWGEPLVTTRLIGILLAGIAGGPITGFCVGLICAGYLIVIDYSAIAPALFIILAGTFSGMLRLHFNFHQFTPLMGAGVALVAELCQIVFIALFPGEPVTQFPNLKALIFTPVVSMIGVCLFLYIIKWIEAEQDIYGARAAQLSLAIASRTLPFLRLGFNSHSAKITANIIYELAKADAVSITGRYKRLAFIGKGTEHHKPGEPILSAAVKEAITSKTMKIINTPSDRGCPFPYCPLKAGVVVPLFSGDKVIGTIEIARVNEETVSELDIHIADGIANLLSVQIQLAEVDKQRKMREKAELKALRAQINPHFLFNTINIIMSFTRTDPDKARSLLGSLATLMQRGYSNQDELVTLQYELAAIMAYLEIAMSRFGDRLDVAVNVDDEATTALIPALSLQPLVENALNHGLFPKLGSCLLVIEAYIEEDTLIITVTDNGVGIPPEKLTQIQAGHSEGVGIMNVHQRLTSLYGTKYGLTINSKPTFGTEVWLRVPFQESAAVQKEVGSCENKSSYC
ncbi:histidine kinase [Sporomusa acidovorans]|uniref:histidine kinase n=1 Tax=Sporomusa acidovorans (strain ATCC 49682 / DSM 3132 / Mol) TaxID=1123286 RepID=A0ABZ3JBS4_SPOA4|nr:histidine kinase [Sporomusa acidovorans]OZC22717.1 sensor histidine kinase YpdA [Sporomusa acidovorans DSM 3132]SDE79682.1 two-component system, LytT family, sensor histidine kinase LytS [Sporomusa acidovorans]